MIGRAAAWVRVNTGPLTLAVLLHIVVGALLVLSTGFNANTTKDMPGRSNEHQPIQAVTVNESDYQAAQASIAKAKQARQEEVERLKKQAAQAQRERKQAEQQLAQLKHQKETTANEAQHQKQQLQQLNSQAQQITAQRKKSQAELEKLKKQAAEAEKARAAEQARLKKIQEQTARAKKEAEAARKAQLRRQMEAEQQQQMSKARGNWIAAITDRVTRSWIRPPDTPPGLDCYVKITQLPSGQVTGAEMQKCNGDQAVQQSIITAVYKASPLPTPDDPSVFSRVITFEFVPDQS